VLGLFPRKVTLDHEDVGLVVPAVRSFLDFLASTGRIDQTRAPVSQLLAELDEIEEEFGTAMRAVEAYHSASPLSLAMQADGVGINDPVATQSWIEAFNGWPPSDQEAFFAATSVTSDVTSRVSLPLDGPSPSCASCLTRISLTQRGRRR